MSAEPMPVDTVVKRVMFMLANGPEIDPNLDPEVRWAIDATIKDMVTKTQFSAFKKDKTFSTLSGTSTYSFEDDFVQILSYGMSYTATPFTQLCRISQRDWMNGMFGQSDLTGDPAYFFITTKEKSDGVWRFRLFPEPTSIISIQYTYLSMPDSVWNTVAGGSDQVIDPRFPSQFFQALVYGSAAKFPQFLDTMTIQKHQMEYENAIKVMCNKSEPETGVVMQKEMYQGRGWLSRVPGWLRGTAIPWR